MMTKVAVASVAVAVLLAGEVSGCHLDCGPFYHCQPTREKRFHTVVPRNDRTFCERAGVVKSDPIGRVMTHSNHKCIEIEASLEYKPDDACTAEFRQGTYNEFVYTCNKPGPCHAIFYVFTHVTTCTPCDCSKVSCNPLDCPRGWSVFFPTNPGACCPVCMPDCKTACGKSVRHGWQGAGDGPDSCRHCECDSGTMKCGPSLVGASCSKPCPPNCSGVKCPVCKPPGKPVPQPGACCDSCVPDGPGIRPNPPPSPPTPPFTPINPFDPQQ